MLPFFQALALALVAFGLTYVITGSEIGFIFRFTWCSLLKRHKFTRYFWALVRCPPCNAWWTGFVVGALHSGFTPGLQLAFTTCGLTAVLQKMLGGDGIAAGEDFMKAFDLEEEEQDGKSRG